MSSQESSGHALSDWMKRTGQMVTVFRNNVSFQMQLDGRLTAYEECCHYASCNPGTIRIENENQEVLWSPQ